MIGEVSLTPLGDRAAMPCLVTLVLHCHSTVLSTLVMCAFKLSY